MSYVGQDFPPCDISEVQTFSLDFSAILVPGEEIISAEWNAYLRSGSDPNPEYHVSGAPTFTATGTSQQFDWSVGTNALGNRYTIQCIVVTNAGNTYEQFAECEMAVIYAPPLTPVSLAERFRYRMVFASGVGRTIASATVTPGTGGTGMVDEVEVTDDEVTWIIEWPWWTEEVVIIVVVVTYTNGDKEVVTLPVEVVQPPNVEPVDPADVCAGVYLPAPWDRINIA